MSAIERVTCVFLLIAAGMSFGGFLVLSMEILSAIGVTGINDSFVLGWLWGAWSVVMGRWVGRHWLNNMRQQQGGRDDG